ncbi:MAG: hypothetical protein M1822_000295 [Bathelium mastoideum]|nr:MAG: hypothetical protein M1822_000295 [Bathelium mastoideum]
MHGLLALAALHVAYLRPVDSCKYLQSCDKHQAIALQKFRSILSSPVDPQLADALFALSATLSLSSMARSCTPNETATMGINAVVELFILTKGIRDVIQLSYEQIKQGPMAEMLDRQAFAEGKSGHLPFSVQSRFGAIREMLSTYGLDPEALEHCQSALTELEEIYKYIAYFSQEVNIETGGISRWQVSVSMGYVKLMQSLNPPALVILAYYAAALTAVRTAWYTHNWAEYALHGISEALNDNMQHWLHWPMLQIEERMSELGVQSPGQGRAINDLS